MDIKQVKDFVLWVLFWAILVGVVLVTLCMYFMRGNL